MGFVQTKALGIIGACLATIIGWALNWYHSDQVAGIIATIVGAVIVLFIWHRVEMARISRR
jgi:uncharacterized membrane protein YeaQ/YmgE (transglycosylase-associated protein family)